MAQNGGHCENLSIPYRFSTGRRRWAHDVQPCDGDPILILDEDNAGSSSRAPSTAASWSPWRARRHLPRNYVTSRRKLYFRTAPGNKLAQVTINDKVLFEADGIMSRPGVVGSAPWHSAGPEQVSRDCRGRRAGARLLGAHTEGLLRGDRSRFREWPPLPVWRATGARFLAAPPA